MMYIYHCFYVQPMNMVYIETAVMFVVWTVLMLILPKKPRRIFAITGLCLSLLLILSLTILKRNSNGSHDVSLIPFVSFTYAKTQPEFYRTMYMNILLFIPLGLSMPFALPKKLKLKPLITIGTGFLLSVIVEACQYIFILGRCETDDVIMNTIGVLIGVLSYLIVYLIRIRKEK